MISRRPHGFIHRLCLFCALCVAAPHPTGARSNDKQQWKAIERDVQETRFPQSFIDSLADANKIGENAGLRLYKRRPFQSREKLVFDGGWGAIRAGFLIVSAEPGKMPDTYEFTGKVATNSFVSAFYRVRDYVITKVDARGLYPLFFEQHISEGKYRDKRWTHYDHVQNRVFTYKSRNEPLETPRFSHNYVSLLFYLRTLDFKPGEIFTIDCFVHEESHAIKFKVLKRETVEVPAGEFRCLKLRPTLVGEGRGFTKRDKMLIWVTDDEFKMPVLVKSKVAIGSLSAKLLHYERE